MILFKKVFPQENNSLFCNEIPVNLLKYFIVYDTSFKTISMPY